MGMDTDLTILIHEAPSSMIFPDPKSAIKRLAAQKPIFEFRFNDEKTRVFLGNDFPKAVMFRQIDVDLGDDLHPPLVINNMMRDGPWWEYHEGDYPHRGELMYAYGKEDWENYSVGEPAFLYHPCKYIDFMDSKYVAGGIWDDVEGGNVLRSIEAFALLALGTSYDEKLMKELDKPQTSLLRIPKGWSPLSAAYRSKKLTYLTPSDFYPNRFGALLGLMELKADGVKSKMEKGRHSTKAVRSLVSTMRALQKRVKSGKSTILTQFLIDVNGEGNEFELEGVPIEDRPFIDGRQTTIVNAKKKG